MRGMAIAAVFFLVIGVSAQSLAVEVGGEFAVQYDGKIKDSLELELYLPQFGNDEIKYAFVIDRLAQDLLAGDDATYFAKKLYLKHRFTGWHLTVGRQPVSWAFGSLLNPVDYTLGSVALDEEYSSKYTDAVEAYIPINWNSSLSVVTSFPNGFTTDTDKIKWGTRARMGVQGYDVTLNYVQEPVATPLAMPRQRLGFTFKGDLGDFGVYGAFGRYFESGKDSSNSYLVGADYSFNLNYDTKVSLQLEYVDDLVADIVAGIVSIPIDEFSSASLVTTVNLADGKTVWIPRYQNTLPGGVDLAVDCTISEGTGPVGTVRLSYPF